VRVVVRLLQVGLVAALVTFVVYQLRGGPAADARTVAAPSWPAEVQIGPDGLSKVKLAMTEAQATATGEVAAKTDWAAITSKCSIFGVNHATYHFSRDHGLAVISGPPQARTAEGIHVGSSVAEVTKAYPKTSEPTLGAPAKQLQTFGYYDAPVPGNPAAIYVFIFRIGSIDLATAKLGILYLSLRDQGEQCTHAT
jgi:hypothetical protein